MITCKAINTGGLGRFGNQMFSIASTIGIAIKNNQSYGFPEWINRDNALFGDNADVMAQYFVNPLPGMVDVQYQDIPYHWECKDYNIPTGDWNICSHLQDPRYFEHCMPLIRDTFRMKDEPEQNEYCAIHYRAGDYIDDPNAYHPRCSKEYYIEAMKIIGSNDCVVFTDDKKAAWEIFPYFNIISKNYIDDFRFMKRCKHFITANSSFSFMAALLGEHPDKKIIMPKRWFGSQANITFEGYHKEAIIL